MSIRWNPAILWLVGFCLVVGVGCSSGFKAERHQVPLYQLDEKTDVALVHIDVPSWLDGEFVELHNPESIIRKMVTEAFEDTNLNIIDRTGTGVGVDIYAATEPLIFDTASFVATEGHPYRYDATHGAQAYGARPITWGDLSSWTRAIGNKPPTTFGASSRRRLIESVK